MSQLTEKYTEVIEKINSISVRERLILCATVVVGLCIGMMTFVIEPLLEVRAEHQESISKFSLESQENQASLTILGIEYSVDPNKNNRDRLRELTHQLRRIEGDIQSKSQHLVPANKTAKVLQEMLENQGGLYLSSLEKLDPVVVPITDEEEATPESESAIIASAIESTDLEHVKVLMAVVENSDPFLKQLSSQTSVYKHGVKMELEGQFLDVLEYIVALEKMDWKVYWKSFHYTSSQYPTGKASFVIETLGFDNGWIGV